MFILWLCESRIDIMNLNQETQDIIGVIKQWAGGFSVILYHKHTGTIAYYHTVWSLYGKTGDCWNKEEWYIRTVSLIFL